MLAWRVTRCVVKDLLRPTGTGGMNLCVKNSSALGASDGRTKYETYIARKYSKTSGVDDTSLGAMFAMRSEWCGEVEGLAPHFNLKWTWESYGYVIISFPPCLAANRVTTLT